MSNKLRWVVEQPAQGPCIIIGCDYTCSWMLRWWFEKYSKYNSFPVVLADFGMRQYDLEWATSRTIVIPMSGGREYKCNWFKKPEAILNCPFDKMAWIDVDCEIRGDISPIFDYLEPNGFAGAPDQFTTFCTRGTINTGVLVVKHGNQIVVDWASRCFTDQRKHRGDQEILAAMEHSEDYATLPTTYNHLRLAGKNPDAIIYHWTGAPGKRHIKTSVTPRPNVVVKQRPLLERKPNFPTIRRTSPLKKAISPRQPVLIPKRPILTSLASLQRRGIRKPI